MSPVQRGSRDWKPLLHRLYKGGPSGRTLRVNRMFICESNTVTKSSEKPWDARKDSVALIVFVFGVLLTSRFFRIWIPFSLLGWSNAWVTSLETSTSWDGWSTKRRATTPWNHQARFLWLSSRLNVSTSCASNVIISWTSTFKESIKIRGFVKITCHGCTDWFLTDCKRNRTDSDFLRRLRTRDVR